MAGKNVIKRDSSRNAIKRCLTASKKAESFDQAELDSYFTLLADHWSSFLLAQEAVELSCGEDTIQDQEAEREQGEQWYREALANFNRASFKIKANISMNNEIVPAPTRANIKLPPLGLPRFSGEPKDWRPFHDAFVSVVHNAGTLSGAQKLQYLRCSLSDSPRALQIVNGFPITDNNYQEAWTLLKKRYDVQRVLIDSHFRAIFSLKKLNNESSTALRNLVDATQEHFQSLKALGRPVTNWDDWLVHLTVSKLDLETHRQWELSLTEDTVPKFDVLVAFLEKRCRSLDAIDSHIKPTTSKEASQKGKSKTAFSSLIASVPTQQQEHQRSLKKSFVDLCPVCSDNHKIFSCDKFRAFHAKRRIAFVKDNKLCTNCLGSGHLDEKCRSSNTCRTCHIRHHTFLHEALVSSSNEPSSINYMQSYSTTTRHHVLLGTALVNIIDESGRYQPARVLFDNGSHLTFVSENCVQRLKLRRYPKTTVIQGIGATAAGSSKGEVQIKLVSSDNSYSTTINAQVLPKLTSMLPPVHLYRHNWSHLDSLKLADPHFNAPAAIDILVGADEMGQFLCAGLIKGPIGTPIAQQSTLGWILFGKVIDNASFVSNASPSPNAISALPATSAITASPATITSTAAPAKIASCASFALNASPSPNAVPATYAQTASPASIASPAAPATFAQTASPANIATIAASATNTITASPGTIASAAAPATFAQTASPTNIASIAASATNTVAAATATNATTELATTASATNTTALTSTISNGLNSAVCLFCNTALTKAVAKFWQIEALPDIKHLSIEEKSCEKIFKNTHYRQEDGRYVVSLPFKPDCTLGNSRHAAIRSLHRMESLFLKDECLRDQYKNFIQEFIDLGHMEKVSEPPVPGKHYYMPHRAVLKDTSTTTKLRVVFNASCRSTSGFSLNDTQMIGPQLQPDLYLALIRMRTYRFALSADVTKMYRQVRINKKHIDYQRIVWRNSPEDDIEDYRILTVTYGVASSSYLAVKSVQQIALDEGKNYPEASNVIRNHFYMDDLLTGCYNEEDLQRIQTDVSSLLNKGGFCLRKWSSNSSLVINSVPEDQREVLQPLDFSDTDGVRTLGLQWDPCLDQLSFSVKTLEVRPTKFTKRLLLSEASKLFDPLGLLAPTTIIPKMLFQRLWQPKVDWDEAVPDDVSEKWLHYRQHIVELAEIKVPRWIVFGIPNVTCDIHGFADASQSAYAAAVYIRTISPTGEITVKLLTAKTRVAPLKATTMSLPRLELCAAALLVQLVKTIKPTLENNIQHVFGWTDSSIALAWIRQFPGKWCTFVANRVSQIQETIPPENWYHVPSADNPADCATRGILPENLAEHSLWWNGPVWLQQPKSFWPPQQLFSTNLDQRSGSVNIATTSFKPLPMWELIDRYSSLRKLKHITAYVLRFIFNIQQNVKLRKQREANPFRNHQHLQLFELEEALLFWVKQTQSCFFNDDIKRLASNRPVTNYSKLLKLHPFLDDKGMLRVGGRLKNAALGHDKKYPLLLPKISKLTILICNDLHRITLHAGSQFMQAMLQNRFWVIGARGVLRKISLSCLKCRKQTHQLRQQLMGDLPRPRVTSSRPFLSSGVDFAGPVKLRLSRGRGSKAIKGYIAVFICMATGAMHLELASDLSSATFISVFKRFVSRRGHCKDLYSDNGTNFVGAEKELKIMLSEACKNEVLANYLSDDGTTWHFNPPVSPHMGGYWETAVKRVKFHLRRTLGENLLIYEEFATLLAEIEACVNSRPLCSISSDANDLSVLTPGHFLIGEPLKTIPEPETEDYQGHLVNRWHRISSLRQHFWRRWSSEYLVQLQQRSKWTRSCPNLKMGDLVAIRDENLPPTKWKLGRITNVHPGADGKVRVVTIQTSAGLLTRPIVKVSPLLSFDD